MNEAETPLGEIVAANTSGFVAQIQNDAGDSSGGSGALTLAGLPAFGAFVRVGAATVGANLPMPDGYDPFDNTPQPVLVASDAAIALYGVVCHAESGTLELNRPLAALGPGEPGFGQALAAEVVATRFSVIVVAHAHADGIVRPYLPPRPPRPGAPVFAADETETRRLTGQLEYLRPLLTGATNLPNSADELVAALLRHAWRAHGGGEAFLLRAGRELATLLPNDYDRLRAIVSRVTG